MSESVVFQLYISLRDCEQLIVNKMCYRFDSQNSAYLWIHFSNVTLKTAFTVAKLKKKNKTKKSENLWATGKIASATSYMC